MEINDGGIRDMLASLMDMAGKGKKDLTEIVGNELKNLMKKVDARELLLKVLSQGVIEIDAKIRIVPKSATSKERDTPKAKTRRTRKPSTK